MSVLPRLKIAHLPTPVENLTRLGSELGGYQVLVKRDDQTGLAFGGNKTRKLEFLLAAAQAHGAERLITTGALQSNHCRQTAAAAARTGMKCTLVLTGDEPEYASGNYLLDRLLGAQFVFTTRENRDQTLDTVFNDSWSAGERPYLVPYGGSSPIGAAAYAFALEELLQQGYHPDWIVFASSSGGTQAGLCVGAVRSNFKGRILGISIDEPQEILCQRVAALANETGDRIGIMHHFSVDDILVNDQYRGGGYGVMSNLERDAIRRLAKGEGLLLDPVYTGRAMGAMLDLLEKGFFKQTEQILFWHTGGSPALFAAQYQDVKLT